MNKGLGDRNIHCTIQREMSMIPLSSYLLFATDFIHCHEAEDFLKCRVDIWSPREALHPGCGVYDAGIIPLIRVLLFTPFIVVHDSFYILYPACCWCKVKKNKFTAPRMNSFKKRSHFRFHSYEALGTTCKHGVEAPTLPCYSFFLKYRLGRTV